MSTARKIEIWGEISRLLREYELAQIEAVRTEIAASYDSLRQKMQVLALETANDDDDDGG